VEAPEDGVLARILVPANQGKIKVSEPIALLAEEGDDLSNLPEPETAPSNSSTNAGADTAAVSESLKATNASVQAVNTALSLSPAVAHMLDLYEIDPSRISRGSGPKGRILKGDVLHYLQAQGIQKPPAKKPPTAKAAPTPVPNASAPTERPRSPSESGRPLVRGTVGVKASAAAAQISAKQDVSATLLLNLQQRLVKSTGTRYSLTDFVIRATGMAIRDVPESQLSSSASGVNVAIPMLTPGGMLTPVITQADTKGIAAIANDMSTLHKRAKQNKVGPEDCTGSRAVCIVSPGAGVFEANTTTPLVLTIGEARRVLTPAETTRVLDSALDFLTDNLATSTQPHQPADDTLPVSATVVAEVAAVPIPSTTTDIFDALTSSTARSAAPRSPLPTAVGQMPTVPNQALSLTLTSHGQTISSATAAKLLCRIQYYLEHPERMIL
ncbi:hypothetical protein H4R35_002866, partial [Dimargaris xerosporica]